MAIELRREVENPLALHPKENLPVRQLSVQGVQNPMQTGGNAGAERMNQFLQAMGNLQGGISALQDQQRDGAITEGKLAYMSGATEEQMAATGNRYNMQGWQSLSSVDKANKLFMDEMANLDKLAQLTPDQYQKHLMETRKNYLDNLPSDPVTRKLFAGAFEDVGPRLAQQHAAKHNEYNLGESEREFSNVLSSGSVANADHSRVIPGSTSLKLSDAIVDTQYNTTSADERHIAILTMLGEAGGEGEMGMAAVAHVMKNRTTDPRWGGTIKSVALAPKQFSTWNKGAGGTNPAGRYKAGTPLYERAAKVYDAVMSGRHVDPTGGATHFYSPRGMDKLVNEGSQGNRLPKWLQQEQARSGGTIKIGGHIFVGKASGSSVGRSSLAAPTVTDGPATATVLDDADFDARYGDDVQVAESEEDVQRLEQEMFNPSNSDLSIQPGTPTADVAEAQQIPVSTSPRPQSQVQELIRGYEGLPRDRKAKVVAETMRRQLEDGDDSLYHDAGGVALLQELGADASDIDRVRAAYSKYKEKDADKFDRDEERWLQTIRDRAEAGDETVLDEIEDRAADGTMDGKTATSLFRQVSAELSKVGDNRWKNNPDAQEAIVNLSQFIKDGGEPRQVIGKLEEIAETYNLPATEVTRFMDQMYNLYEQKLDKDRTAAATALAKHNREAAIKAEADAALSRGYGLADVSGNVTIVDEAGNKSEVSAKEYGIQRVQVSEYEAAKQAVAEGADQEDALALAESNIYSTLRKQNVVDTKMANFVTASLAGSIIDDKGQVSQDAVRSMEFYMRMANNPDVGEAYMARMVDDPGARAIIETARGLYAGRYNLEESVKKAYGMLNDPNVDVSAKMTTDRVFHREMSSRVNKIMDSQFGHTLLGSVLGDAGFASSDVEIARAEAMRENSPIKQEIERAAQAHYLGNPRLSPDTAIRLAAQDVANNVDVVAGNLVMGSAKQNRKLSQVMQLDRYGPRATEDAVDAFLVENGKELFGSLFETEGSSQTLDTLKRAGHAVSWGVFSGEGWNYRPGAKTRWIPDYNIQYNQQTGQIGIQLYRKPDGVSVRDREELVGPMRWIAAATVGTKYREQMGLGEYYQPNIVERGIRGAMELFRPTE